MGVEPLNGIPKTKAVPWSLQYHQNMISINLGRGQGKAAQGGKVLASSTPQEPSSKPWRPSCYQHHSPPLLLSRPHPHPPGPGGTSESGLCQGTARPACSSATAKRQEGQVQGLPSSKSAA